MTYQERRRGERKGERRRGRSREGRGGDGNDGRKSRMKDDRNMTEQWREREQLSRHTSRDCEGIFKLSVFQRQDSEGQSETDRRSGRMGINDGGSSKRRRETGGDF